MYKNPFTPGFEVLNKTTYNADSHGSLSNMSSYLITNDVPNYAAMFYSPTEHEIISSIKYGNFPQGYDNLSEIRESLNGNPVELYIPSSFVVSDGVGRKDTVVDYADLRNSLMEKADKNALKEIEKAQKELSRKIKVEFEDTLVVRKTKRTIILEEKDKSKIFKS